MRWSKQWLVRIVTIGMALCFAGCSETSSSAKMPFSADYCQEMTQEEVLSELEKAGFTKVETTEIPTTNQEDDGKVVAVLVNGTGDYKAKSKWETDTQIEVEVYKFNEINVSMEVTTGGEIGKPVFTIETNLPDGTILSLTLQNTATKEIEEQSVTVQNGTAQSKRFGKGKDLAGAYELSVDMKLADQSEKVKELIGEHGECLAGAMVADGEIHIEQSYEERAKLNIVWELSVSGNVGAPVFVLDTNLPDGTIVTLEADGETSIPPVQELTVKDGKAKSAPVTEVKDAMEEEWSFSFGMMPWEQPQEIMELMGEHGEYLEGSAVVTNNSTKYVLSAAEYDPKSNKIIDKASLNEPVDESASEEKRKVENAENEMKQALSAFGENCTISLEGYLFTVDVWQDGMAQTALLASMENKTEVSSWESIVNTTETASKGLQVILEKNDCGNYMVQLNLRNDANTDNILLTAMWGITTYNCVD